ncbi:hypothetical protein Tco_0998209 [Tanacetum coccineum]
MPYAFNCGSVQPMCCGMWRCSGLVLGIIGMSASSTRSLGFKIRVYNYDAHEAKSKLRIEDTGFILSQYVKGRGKHYTHSKFAYSCGEIIIRSLGFEHGGLRGLRNMDTLNFMRPTSTLFILIYLDDTVQSLNADCLQHLKPGAENIITEVPLQRCIHLSVKIENAFWVLFEISRVVLDFVDVTIPYSVTYLLEYIPMDALSDSDEEETETL